MPFQQGTPAYNLKVTRAWASDCVVIAKNIIPYPPPAEVSRSDGGG
jgi:hypothetical protein